MKEIINWLVLRNIFEVRGFDDLTRFCRKQIKKFSSICAPIVEIVK